MGKKITFLKKPNIFGLLKKKKLTFLGKIRIRPESKFPTTIQ